MLPVDAWMAAFNALLAIVWLPLAPTVPLARWMLATHLLALTLPILLHRHRRPLSPIVALLRELYPVLWVCAFWSELGLRHPWVPTALNDALIVQLDLLVFGGAHPNLAWMPAMPWPWFSELMHGAYFAYYPLVIGLPLILLCRGCEATTREVVVRLTATYLGCFAIYACFPVVGPLEMYPAYTGPLTDGTIYGWTRHIRSVGDSLGTAFPSSHVAGTTTVAIIAWCRCHRAVAIGATALAVVVAFATVYTQNHFAVDAVAGILVSVTLQLAGVPAMERWMAQTARAKTRAARAAVAQAA